MLASERVFIALALVFRIVSNLLIEGGSQQAENRQVRAGGRRAH